MARIADRVAQMRGQSLAAIVAEIERLEDAADPALPEGFGEFWSAWPHKVGKPAAQRAYKAKIKTHSFDAIIEGVYRYISSKPADRPWLNPATFLNQERWLDEPAQTFTAPRGADFFDMAGDYFDARHGAGGSQQGNRLDVAGVAQHQIADHSRNR